MATGGFRFAVGVLEPPEPQKELKLVYLCFVFQPVWGGSGRPQFDTNTNTCFLERAIEIEDFRNKWFSFRSCTVGELKGIVDVLAEFFLSTFN